MSAIFINCFSFSLFAPPAPYKDDHLCYSDLIEAGGEAGLLGGGEDERLVVALQHLVGHPLKVPGSLAHPVRPDGHLDHVVLAHGLHNREGL